MGTTRVVINVDGAIPVSGMRFPEYRQDGYPVPVSSYSFDAATGGGMAFIIPNVQSYGLSSGAITSRLVWYAATATAGDVMFSSSLAAITPHVDSQNVETKTWALEASGIFTHLGSVAQRLMTGVVVITGVDSLASGDYLAYMVARSGASTLDTMAGDARIAGLYLEYSDT